MDTLWSPWRSQYVSAGQSSPDLCVFCSFKSDPEHDEQNFVVYRGNLNFVVLNIYPYTSGHMLIVPYVHLGQLDEIDKETSDEMMDIAKRAQTVLRTAYQPDGYNLGMNLGKAAGAGIADHLHLHILPRWNGDTNFMTTVNQARVLPEDLSTTYEKLRTQF